MRFTNFFLKQIFFGFVFGASAMLLAFYSPMVVRKYFDKTVYYQVELPIKIEHNQPHYPCSFIDAYFKRTALTDLEGTINLDLVMTPIGDRKNIVGEVRRTLTAKKGTTTIITHWPIDCDAKPGEYIFEGFATYEVNDVTKRTPLVTEPFKVESKPEIKPETTK